MADFATLIQPTLEWLKQGAPHTTVNHTQDVGFNMAWVYKQFDAIDYQLRTCGTACCILGHMSLVHDLPTGCEDSEAFGLTEDQFWELFYPDNMTTYNAADAVRTIEHFLATGEIKWEKS